MGPEGVLDALGGNESLDFDVQGSESWVVENVSAGGFGAVVPQLKGDLAARGRAAPMQSLEAQRGERQHVYIPQGVAECGEDYEIARFREMIRES